MVTVTNIIKINYVDAKAGAGKTYGAARIIAEKIGQGQKVVLVQPTERLIEETVGTTFPAMEVPSDAVTRITSGNAPGEVIARIIELMNSAEKGVGECLVITHAAFMLLASMYVHRRAEWEIIFDEPPEVQTAYCLNLPNTHRLLTSHVSVADTTDPVYWCIEKKAGSLGLEEIARNELADDVYASFQDFAGKVVSDHWTVWVRADRYSTMTANFDAPGVPRQLNAFAVLNPTIFAGFASVTIMGAFFTQSLCYLLWSRNRAAHVRFRDVTSRFRLRYADHPNGDTLSIYYAQDRHFSKTLRDKPVKLVDGRTTPLFDALIGTAQEMYGEQTGIAVLTNNDRKDIEGRFVGGEKLPAWPHGINTFQHLDHAVLMIACNPSGQHQEFLKHYGEVDADDIRTAIHRQVVYQAACRISIRDPSNTNRKSLFVPDRETAGWLQSVFPGSTVDQIDGIFDVATATEIAKRGGRPRKHESAAEKQRAYREAKAWTKEVHLQRDIRLRLVNGHGIGNMEERRAGEIAPTMTELANAAVVAAERDTFQGTFFLNRMQTVGVSSMVTSFDELVATFRDAAAHSLAVKDHGMMWSPTLFVPNTPNLHATFGEPTRAGYINIAWSRHVMLDNDGGDLAPETFAALFPNLRMVLYSTWSTTAGKPKWRALIPTDFVMDIEGYKLAASALVKHVEQTTRSKLHGFDPSKLKPTDRFYLPCIGPDAAASFFREFTGTERSDLEVYDWVKRAIVEPAPEPIQARPAPLPPLIASGPLAGLQAALMAQSAGKRPKAELIEAAMSRWQVEGNQPGHRDRGFFVLACALADAGCDEAEGLASLRHAAGGNPDLKSKSRRKWRDAIARQRAS